MLLPKKEKSKACWKTREFSMSVPLLHSQEEKKQYVQEGFISEK